MSAEYLGALAAVGVLMGCDPPAVEPAARTGAAVLLAGPASSAGVGNAAYWRDGILQLTPDTSPCPHQKEALEKSLGLTEAVSCPTVRAKSAVASGNGDDPVGPAVAPHCYVLKSGVANAVILVVQYAESGARCTRVAGIAVLPKK